MHGFSVWGVGLRGLGFRGLVIGLRFWVGFRVNIRLIVSLVGGLLGDPRDMSHNLNSLEG